MQVQFLSEAEKKRWAHKPFQHQSMPPSCEKALGRRSAMQIGWYPRKVKVDYIEIDVITVVTTSWKTRVMNTSEYLIEFA